MGWKVRFDETRRLSHVYIFMKVALQKNVIDVQLSKRPILRDG